jgi:hypothetical protein
VSVERTLFNKFINGKGKRYNKVSNVLFGSKCEDEGSRVKQMPQKHLLVVGE